jgi:aryl-alcohol dehydrogenase-like predicted oxidoreductase
MIFKHKIGLGTALLGRSAEHEEFAEFAIGNGVRLFDIAEKYVNGEAERIIGRQIKASNIHRDEFDIITKFSPDLDPVVSLKESLTRLQLDYVDAFLVHWLLPHQQNVESLKTIIAALFELKEQGLIKHYGASNVPINGLKLWAKVEAELGIPAGQGIQVCEYRYSLVRREADIGLHNYLQEKGYTAMPYSPFGGGRMSGSAKPPQPGFPGDFWVNEKTHQLLPIAESIGATVPQLILAFCNRFPNSVIFPQTFKKENLLDNMDSIKFIPKITKTVFDQIEQVYPMSFSVDATIAKKAVMQVRESLPD